MKRAIWVVAMALLPSCSEVPQEQATLPAPDLQSCADLQAVTEDRERYGIPAPPGDDEMLRRCRESQTGTASILPATAPSPTELESAAPTDEVQLERRGNAYMVPVRINATITLPFLLDTGATDLAIPADVALTLIRAGALTSEDFIGKSPYSLANGSQEIGEEVIIRELQVGQHVVNNVRALISRSEGELLLGQSFLSKFGKITIDYNRLVLILAR
jgi:aspartyl protease family protein